MAAAVADWHVEEGAQKIKKTEAGPPALKLVENPDILAGLAKSRKRPRFCWSALRRRRRTSIANAKAKLARKGCDWIVANDVSAATGIMGGTRNRVHLVSSAGRGGLAGHVEGGGGGAAGRAHRQAFRGRTGGRGKEEDAAGRGAQNPPLTPLRRRIAAPLTATPF